MESLLVSQFENTRISMKPKLGFIKDAPKVSKYSLADASFDDSNNSMDYHIQLIKNEDRERVIKFLRRFFFRDEPLNHSIQLIPEGEDSTCLELEEYSTASISENMSVMALSASGNVVGVSINGTMEEPTVKDNAEEDDEPDYITNCQSPKFKKILRLLHHTDKTANIPRRYPGKKVLEVRIISVDSNWRGKGIGAALVEKSMEMAREHHYDMLRSDCSSHFSGKLFEKYGFEKVFRLKYKDYVDKDGCAIFTPALPHDEMATFVKKL